MFDRSEINDLIARYAHAYDSRDIGLLEQCFTPDAIMRSDLPDGTVVYEKSGRDAVLQMIEGVWAESQGQRRHIMTNTLVTKQSNESAAVLSYLLLIKYDDGRPTVVATGVYQDTVVKEQGWRFKRRDVRMDSQFRVPSPPSPAN